MKMAEDVHYTCSSRKSQVCEHSVRNHEQWRAAYATVYAAYAGPCSTTYFPILSLAHAHFTYHGPYMYIPLHDSFCSWHRFTPVFTAYIYLSLREGTFSGIAGREHHDNTSATCTYTCTLHKHKQVHQKPHAQTFETWTQIIFV